jgi:hypothetical protein
VDNTRVQTYWQLGERIVREELKLKDRAEYGQYLIINLSRDLQIRRQELYKIVKFYRLYENVGSSNPIIELDTFLVTSKSKRGHG